MESKEKIKFPHTYVIIFSAIILMAICTYFIPAGVYEMIEDSNTGMMLVDPDSYHTITQNPVGLFDVFLAIPKGMIKTADIIFFIFIVGGAFGIIQGTGAIEAGIGNMVKKLKGKEKLLIPVIITVFAIGGATIGMFEETIIFVPIGIVLARALGYDAITGVAMVYLGAMAGFNAGFLNPFTVGVAQEIAGLPIFSGIGLRLVNFVLFTGTTILYTSKYAKKVKEDPKLSLVADLEKENKQSVDFNILPELTKKHGYALAVVVIGFIILAFGVIKYDWYIVELAAIFIAIGILAGLVGGSSINKLADDFIDGAQSLTYAALIVGLARGILLVMEDGQIIDTIVHSLAGLVSKLPSTVAALAMYLVQIIINTFIPSGSGQAAATMPIMVPLSDIVGITRQTAVLAFEFGNGFTNSVIPTSAALMAVLSIAEIPFQKWIKWIGRLMIYWILLGAILIIISVKINYGPF